MGISVKCNKEDATMRISICRIHFTQTIFMTGKTNKFYVKIIYVPSHSNYINKKINIKENGFGKMYTNTKDNIIIDTGFLHIV